MWIWTGTSVGAPGAAGRVGAREARARRGMGSRAGLAAGGRGGDPRGDGRARAATVAVAVAQGVNTWLVAGLSVRFQL